MSKINRQGGFTLVELMIVVVIIGILVALFIPRFIDASIRAEASAVLLDINFAETKHWDAHQCYSADSVVIAGLDVSFPHDAWCRYEIRLDDSLGYCAAAICEGDTVATIDRRGIVKFK